MLTAHQLEIRKGGIGASEIAAVCGLDPSKRPIEVYQAKVDGIEGESSEHAEWGQAIEPLIADWYARQCRVNLVECPTLAHPEIPWMLATPDRLWEDLSRGVEVKNVGEHMSFHWRSGPGGEPDYVRAQVHQQMMVTGIWQWDIVACIGGLPPVIYPVEYDREFAWKLLSGGDEFWNEHVLKRVPPPVDDSNVYKEFLARRFPNGRGTRRDEAAGEIAREYELARVEEKQAGERKALLANRLRAEIGGYDCVMGSWGKVSWRLTSAGSRTLRVTLNK